MTVCVLGSLNLDWIARVAALPRPGETVAARDVRALPGDKGADQAIAAARMGAEVRMLGAGGGDAAGALLIAALDDAGVDSRGVARIAEVTTGAAYVSTDNAGENQIVVAAGADACVTPMAMAAAALDGATVFLAQLETPPETVAAFVDAARGRGTRILNAAPARREAPGLFADTEILILNQTELAVLCGAAVPSTSAGAASLASDLLTRGGQAVIVTRGAAGALHVTDRGESLTPVIRVPVIDTTGVGDCFCGALAALIAEGETPITATPAVVAAAALCVSRTGSVPAMPSWAEIEALLASNKFGAGDQERRPASPDLAEAPQEG